ncbi:hypothetical protein [Streptomyces sp. A012304]|uniref:hypothetical protein n=1 Tax=Streptomyces sp. A012304 TaxID=375446 RepID=UPI00222F85CC|nr:hypothetical protein [Streptomyces sp. A012304]
MAKDYGDCQIYLRGGNRESVTALVAATLGAPADDHYTVRSGRTVFEIRDNPDYGLAEDFIGWPFTIEAEADGPDPVLVEAVFRNGPTPASAPATAPARAAAVGP